MLSIFKRHSRARESSILRGYCWDIGRLVDIC